MTVLYVHELAVDTGVGDPIQLGKGEGLVEKGEGRSIGEIDRELTESGREAGFAGHRPKM